MAFLVLTLPSNLRDLLTKRGRMPTQNTIRIGYMKEFQDGESIRGIEPF